MSPVWHVVALLFTDGPFEALNLWTWIITGLYLGTYASKLPSVSYTDSARLRGATMTSRATHRRFTRRTDYPQRKKTLTRSYGEVCCSQDQLKQVIRIPYSDKKVCTFYQYCPFGIDSVLIVISSSIMKCYTECPYRQLRRNDILPG
jgi:hypothetical protein